MQNEKINLSRNVWNNCNCLCANLKKASLKAFKVSEETRCTMHFPKQRAWMHARTLQPIDYSRCRRSAAQEVIEGDRNFPIPAARSKTLLTTPLFLALLQPFTLHNGTMRVLCVCLCAFACFSQTGVNAPRTLSCEVSIGHAAGERARDARGQLHGCKMKTSHRRK